MTTAPNDSDSAAGSIAGSSAQLPLVRVLWLSLVAVSLLVYLTGCVIVVLFQQRETRVNLHYLLYAEAEALSSYYAATGELDFPELVDQDDDTPTPVWLRVVRGDEVLASTPGLPSMDVEPFTGEMWGDLEIANIAGERLVAVKHPVWNEPGTTVQAFTPKVRFDERMSRLINTLAVTALLLVPISVLMSRWLAGFVIRPVENLMASIAAISSDDVSPDDLSQRLEMGGRVREIEDLAREFNVLLARVESTLRRMQRFTANASHELRTPIASLRTGIEVCLRRPRTGEEYRQVLGESLQEIRRMHRSVETLLTLAREQEGGRQPKLGDVDLADVAATAAAALRPLVEEKNLSMELEMLPARLTGDSSMLELMVVNLLDNAIRFSPVGGRVALSTGERRTVDGPVSVLSVADEGPGVAPDEGERIFSRHYQSGRGDELPSSARVGGIGLDLVRWVVEAHRGRVRLVEPPPDQPRGATFEVELPAG